MKHYGTVTEIHTFCSVGWNRAQKQTILNMVDKPVTEEARIFNEEKKVSPVNDAKKSTQLQKDKTGPLSYIKCK